MKLYVLLITFISSLFVHSLMGVPAEEEMVNISFTLYCNGRQAMDADAMRGAAAQSLELMFERSPGSVESITISPGKQSRVLQYTGPEKIAFFNEYKAESGEMIRNYFTHVTVPKGYKEVMFLVFPRSEGDASDMGIFPVDVSETSLPKGTVQLINIGQNPLACEAMGQQELLAPLSSMQIEITKRQLPVRFAIRDESSWKLVFSTTRTVRMEKRYVFLVVPVGTTDNYRMIGIVLPNDFAN